MKHNKVRAIVAFALAVIMIFSCAAALAENLLNVRIDLTYQYDTARSMLTLINNFRTSNTWLWNEDNTAKVLVSGRNALTYDYGLERIAMKRAAECAVNYSHTRPNGSMCYTLYPNQSGGENIAAGQTSVQAVMTSWIEEDKDYSGQGHRRNLLYASFTHVGVGCVYASGIYYWCQVFGFSATGEAQSSLSTPAIVEAKDSVLKSAKSGDQEGMVNLSTSAQSGRIKVGDSLTVPEVSGKSGGWGNRTIVLTSVPWISADESIAKVEKVGTGNKWVVTGVKPGKTTISYGKDVTKDEKELTVSLTVVCKTHSLTEHAKADSTCLKEGTQAYWQCDNCGLYYSDANASTEIEGPETIAKKAHTLINHAKADSTCTATGTQAYWECTSCHTLFSDAYATTEITAPVVIAKKAHTLTAHAKVDSTCTAAGTEAYWSCSVCGKYFSDANATTEIAAPVEIAKKAHTLEVHDKNDSTCAETGTEAYWSCSACGKLFSDAAATHEIPEPVVIAKKPHNMTAHKEKVEATCTETGMEAYWYCATCKGLFLDEEGTQEISEPVVIEKKPHTMTKHAEIPATCTKAGQEAYWTCSECNKLYADAKGTKEIDEPVVIEALGHDEVTDPEVKATYEKTGLTEGKHCGRCGKVLTAQKTIPKLEKMPGDVNKDGVVDGRDSVRLMKYLAGETDPETGAPYEIHEDNADVTGDGVLDGKDLLRLVKYLGGEKVTLEEGKVSK